MIHFQDQTIGSKQQIDQGKLIIVIHFNNNERFQEIPLQWRAHTGSVLCLSWSNETQNIASGGDDCQYRIWDSQGTLIYASFVEDHSITSVEFCPKGLYLAVGGFNMLKLCHFTGVRRNKI